MSSVFYLQYHHDKREFEPPANATAISNLSMDDLDEFQNHLRSLDVDGLLILDKPKSTWFLVFGSHVGLIAQRTARRQADNIVRSGYLLPSGERVRERFTLEELSDDNLGDLWKTVQDKYLPATDLRGMRDQGKPKH